MHLGLSDAASSSMQNEQAINYNDEFRSLDDESVKTLCKFLLQPGGVTTTSDPDPGVKVNARAESNLMLAVYFTKHNDRVSRDVTFLNVMLAGVRKLAGKREMGEDSTEGSATASKVHNSNWLNTLEIVEEYLRKFRGVNGAPLSYVVRKQLVPTAEVDDPSNVYDTINEYMIERAPIVVACIVGTTASLEANGPYTASCLTDRATVWAKLTAIFENYTA